MGGGAGRRAGGVLQHAGLYFNLLRDDLGAARDATPINYEIAYTRGVSPGEHTANVHLYRAAPDGRPVAVTVAVSTVRPGHRARRQVLQRDYLLTVEGQEIHRRALLGRRRGRAGSGQRAYAAAQPAGAPAPGVRAGAGGGAGVTDPPALAAAAAASAACLGALAVAAPARPLARLCAGALAAAALAGRGHGARWR